MAFRHYNAVKKKDIQHREAFQLKLAEARVSEGNTKVATVIKNQQLREQQQQVARRIRWTHKSNK